MSCCGDSPVFSCAWEATSKNRSSEARGANNAQAPRYGVSSVPSSRPDFTGEEAEAQGFSHWLGDPWSERSGAGCHALPAVPQPTLLFCMSLLAPFFRSTMAASTLFTAAAQCRADLPAGEKRSGGWGRSGGGGPSPGGCATAWLTQVVHSIDVSVRIDEVLQHALHGQAGGQDQGRRAVMHAGVQVCGPVPDQDLGDRGAGREARR